MPEKSQEYMLSYSWIEVYFYSQSGMEKKVYPWLAFPSKSHDEAIGLADWATEQMMKARLDKELAGGQAGTANYSANYSWNPKKI